MKIKHLNAESGKMWENYRLGFIFPFSLLCRSLPLFVLWKTIFFHVISMSPPWHHVLSPCQFHVTPWDGLSRKKVARMDRDRYFVLFFHSPSSSQYLPSLSLFLDAFSHLYKRVCPSVGRSVRPSVGRSVRPSVGRSVTSYFKNLKMKVFLRVFHQGSLQTSQKCRIASL